MTIIPLDRLADLPDGYRECVSANSLDDAVAIYGRQFSKCWVFRNFYYFEEAE